MSKSAGNFFTVRDIIARYDPQVLRFLMLSAHYRSPLNFSDELMASAKNGYERIVTCVSSLNYLIGKAGDASETGEEAGRLKEADKFRVQFEDGMDDDFNTADALTAIFELVKFINMNTDENSSKDYLESLKKEILTLTDICGLIVEKKEELLDADIDRLIEERQQARKNKDFKRADEIRDQLTGMGIILEDTREGVKWKRA
jgi:cysteinyl-tRNA synthetase